MVMVFSDPRTLDHRPPQGHPERPERVAASLRHLERTGLLAQCAQGLVRPATRAELERVHTPSYLDSVSLFEEAEGGLIEADTWVGTGSNHAALLAAGASVEAVEAVVAGRASSAFALTRPPGHHARPGQAMGFCIYANAAVAAAHAVRHLDLSRVLVVDFDVHHGNGTQEIFYHDPSVFFFSAHRFPFYPGTGAANETGTGPGLGTTRNLPLAANTPRAEYRQAFEATLSEVADRFKPELVLISAGFDAHEEDPVGGLGLLEEDFDHLTHLILDVARVHARGRVVSLLEGGYNVSRLAGCVEVHLGRLISDEVKGS